MAEPPEELWEDILLRLAPDDPASQLRASLVCKLWRRIFSGAGFLRRLGELHRSPPMLGFFHNTGKDSFDFVPTAASSFRSPTAVPDGGRSWNVLDCRHGRVLLHSSGRREFLVWEPMTGFQRLVPCLPCFPKRFWKRDCAAGVMCAADGCGHCSCHGGRFRVVVVHDTLKEDDGGVLRLFRVARVYSSETAAWGEETLADYYFSTAWDKVILAGHSLGFRCHPGKDDFFKYDLRAHTLTVIGMEYRDKSVVVTQAEDGRLGFAVIQHLDYSALQVGYWKKVAGWAPRRTIHLDQVLPPAASQSAIASFANEADTIFLTTNDGIYTIELESCRARKVSSRPNVKSAVHPFFSFYIPGIQEDATGIGQGDRLMLM